MPATTEKEARFMRIAAHASGRKWLKSHGVKTPPVAVAKEFESMSKSNAK